MKLSDRSRSALEAVALPLLALIGALLLFGVFIALSGKSPNAGLGGVVQGSVRRLVLLAEHFAACGPLDAHRLVRDDSGTGRAHRDRGARVRWYWADWLAPACPICSRPLPTSSATAMVLTAAGLAGAAWVAVAGLLRQYRGVNETISSLLPAYTAIALFKHFVERPMRDPTSLNKPLTRLLIESLRIGTLPDADIHWGLVFGIVACAAAGVWLLFTTSGFATRVVGGNARAARLMGLSSTRIIIMACAVGGALAPDWREASKSPRSTPRPAPRSSQVWATPSSSCPSWARHNPWAVIPVAVLFGGFGSAGSLLQRRMDMPDASVIVQAVKCKWVAKPFMPRANRTAASRFEACRKSRCETPVSAT